MDNTIEIITKHQVDQLQQVQQAACRLYCAL